MTLIIFLLIVGLCFYLWKHKKGTFEKMKDEVKDAFSNDDVHAKGKSNSYKPSATIPVNVRKTIIEQQYMTLYDVEFKSKDKTNVEDTKTSHQSQDDKSTDFDDQTTLYDTNGEGHTIYDIASAPVDQPKTSVSEINLAPKDLDTKQTKPESKHNLTRKQFRQSHEVEHNKKTATKANSVTTDALLAEVKERLSKFNK